ncbi:MAG: acyl-CoA dehydrogenase family protein [Pseudomonadota bacterium]
MNFSYSDEQAAIFDMAKTFGEVAITPNAYTWEKAGTIPRGFLKEIGSLGFGGIYTSGEYGGSGLSRLDAVLIFEALSRSCPSVAAFISIHNMCVWMVDSFGTETSKQKWLPKLCAFDKVASYALTEPGSGSDAAALKTKAVRSDEGYRLTGTKAFISGGEFSDVYIVMTRTGDPGPKGISAFLVEDGTEGLSFGAQEKKMGWRSQPTAMVQLDDCKIPGDALLGKIGEGFTYAMKGLDGGRLNISACSLGGAQFALDQAAKYMGERTAFGKTLDQFQALQFKLADMQIRLEAARTLLHKAAWKLDQQALDATKYCAMAKAFVTDVSFDVANDALQLLGGYGYLEDYGIEKIVRDIRVHQILEGTNEVMRLITARSVLAERN